MNFKNIINKFFLVLCKNSSSKEITLKIKKILKQNKLKISKFKCIYYLQFLLFSIRLIIAHYALKNVKYLYYFNYDLPIANGKKLKFVDSNMVLCIMLFLWFEFYLEYIIYLKPNKWFWSLISDFIILNPQKFFQLNYTLKLLNFTQLLNYFNSLKWINNINNFQYINFYSKNLNFCNLHLSNKNRFVLALFTIYIEKINNIILVVMSK